jgi:hypothetical protein
MNTRRASRMAGLLGAVTIHAVLASGCKEDSGNKAAAASGSANESTAGATDEAGTGGQGGEETSASGGSGGGKTPASGGLAGSETSAGGAQGGSAEGGAGTASDPDEEAEELANEVTMIVAADVLAATAAVDYLAQEALHDAVEAETTSNKALDFGPCAQRSRGGVGGASGETGAGGTAGSSDDPWAGYCYVDLEDLALPAKLGKTLRFTGRVGYRLDYPNGIYLLADLQSDAEDAPSEVHIDLMVDFFNARYDLNADDNKITVRSPERRYSWVTNAPTARLDQICARYEKLAPYLNAAGAGPELDAGEAAGVALDTLGKLCELAKSTSDYQKPTTSYLMIDELGLGSEQYLGRLALGYAKSPDDFRHDVDGAVVFWGHALDGVIEPVERTDMAVKLIEWPIIKTQPKEEKMCLAVDMKDGTLVEIAEAVMSGSVEEIDWSGLDTVECPRCITHAECGEGKICDAQTSACVAGCFDDEDCGGVATCAGADKADDVPGQCQGPGDLCNPANPNACEQGTCVSGRCVEECTEEDTTGCEDLQVCSNGKCVDCTAEEQGVCSDQQVCSDNKCVECTTDQTDNCGTDQYCLLNRCVDRCTKNAQCEGQVIDGVQTHCFVTSGECVTSCNNALNKCLTGQTCTNQKCEAPQ